MVYAGFWRRAVAYLIDVALLTGIGIAAFALWAQALRPDALIGWLETYPWVPLLVQGLYFALLESSRLQGTLGKALLGLRVSDYDGRRIGLLRAIVRYFGRLISELILMLGFLMVLFTERKQGLHDFLARTYVLTRDGDQVA
jgi:uncharacterized RDD family membrane protein YckC